MQSKLETYLSVKVIWSQSPVTQGWRQCTHMAGDDSD